MSTPNPIQGITSMIAGSVSAFTDSTVGGVWSSSDNTVATVSVSGLVTAVAAGACQIIYTVSGNSTALQVTVTPAQSLTNGINYTLAYGALANRVNWRSQGLVSDSGRYYEDFHTMNDTKVLDAIRPQDGTSLATYLANKQSAVVLDVLNSTFYAPQVIDKPKLAFWRNDLTLPLQFVARSDGFCGLRLYIGKGDYGIKLNSVTLFFTKTASFNLYLYNDFFLNPIMTIPVSTSAYEEKIINLGEKVILSNLVPTQYKGGRWYLGYYDADLPDDCQAVYYPSGYNRFSPVTCTAFSAPLQPNPVDGTNNFNRSVIGANNLMYGLNLEISTFIDATNSIVQNAHLFDNLIGLKMTERVIQDEIFNYQTGSIQRAIGSVPELAKLYADLNGYKADEFSPFVGGIRNKIKQAAMTVKEGLQQTDSLVIGTA